jgi:hypothetical protein
MQCHHRAVSRIVSYSAILGNSVLYITLFMLAGPGMRVRMPSKTTDDQIPRPAIYRLRMRLVESEERIIMKAFHAHSLNKQRLSLAYNAMHTKILPANTRAAGFAKEKHR